MFDFTQYGFSEEASQLAASYLSFDEGKKPERRVCRRKDGSIYGIAPGKKCRAGSEDWTKAEQLRLLQHKRDSYGRALMKELLRERPDGGNYIEHPEPKTLQMIDAVAKRVKAIDREMNILEGRDPDHKRWVEGDPLGLTRYSNFRSAARDRYEKEIIEDRLKDAKKGDQAIFMAGGPASGKTSLLKKKFGDAKGFAVIDPDALKDYDPVMRVGVAMGMRRAAALAHENSSRVSKDLMREAQNRKVNILMDGTGANADKYIKQMQDLKSKGYKVDLLAQHVPQEVGVTRALDRADRVGRYVPPKFIKHAYETIPGNFERLAAAADRATLNNGQTNSVIMEFEGGRQTGGNAREAAAYRRKYGSGE